MFYTIYKITNKINNKFYVGMHQTENIDDGYMGSGKLIKRAIKKYGVENFTKEILHVFDNEENMKNKEKELVIISEQSYNLCDGGHGGFGYINRNNLSSGGKYANTEEAKKKKSDTLKEYYKNNSKPKEYWQKNVNKRIEKYGIDVFKTFLGKKHTHQTKQKIRETSKGKQKGSNNSQFGTCWVTNGQENKKIKKEKLDEFIELGYYKGRI
jgi:group I intron endonuclease